MSPETHPHEFVPGTGTKHPQYCIVWSGDIVVADGSHGRLTFSSQCGYPASAHQPKENTTK